MKETQRADSWEWEGSPLLFVWFCENMFMYVCLHACMYEWVSKYMYLSTYKLFIYPEKGFSMDVYCQKTAFYYLSKRWRMGWGDIGRFLTAKNGVDVIIDLLIHFVPVRLVIFCRIRECFASEILRPSCLMLILNMMETSRSSDNWLA